MTQLLWQAAMDTEGSEDMIGDKDWISTTEQAAERDDIAEQLNASKPGSIDFAILSCHLTL